MENFKRLRCPKCGAGFRMLVERSDGWVDCLQCGESFTTQSSGQKVKAWIVAGRVFVIPFLLIPLTFLGVALSGFDLVRWGIAMLVVGSVWMAGHYINNWRDFVLGVDKREGGSVAKAYTAAPHILPWGLLSVRTVKLTAAGFLLLGILAFSLWAPLRLDTLVLFLVGVTIALTYTDYIKPRRGSELSWFLAMFAVVAFSYSVVRPFDRTALVAGVVIGMIGPMLHVIDQVQDIKKVIHIRSLAELVFKTRIRLSAILWFYFTAIFVLQIGFILLGWMPKGTLISIFTLPIAHIASVFVDYEIGKGAMLVLFWVASYSVLAGLGALLC